MEQIIVEGEITEHEIQIVNEIVDIFNNTPKPIYDESKLQYNYYHSFDFWKDKFPKGYENIPGFTQIINHIMELNKDNSPLKEMEERKNFISE